MPNNANAMQDDVRGNAQTWSGTDRAGFCQECGQVLTPGTLRHVGSGIFCTDCAAHAGGPNAWKSVYAGAPGTKDHRTRSSRSNAAPRPRLAAWLGFMPGVGAMYNGQYGKGALHLVVFVALLAMADHVSDVLYWLVWGWVLYQAFDAYHTAVARRDGQPIPDPFGFNDVGGRFFGGTPGRPDAPPPGPAQATSARTARPFQSAPFAAAAPPNATAWNGEKPGEHSGENPYDAPYKRAAPHAEPTSPPMYAEHTPYAAVRQPSPALHPVPPTPLEGTRRFPVAALWLIGLGLIFLVGNLLPSWHLSGEWVAILALALLAAWSAAHRWTRLHASPTGTVEGRSLICIFSLPAVLLLSCFLLILDAVHAVGIDRTWPVILVFWGALLFIQRLLPASTLDLRTARPVTGPESLPRSAFDHDDVPFD